MVTGMGRLEGTRVVELGVKQDDFMYFVGYRLNYRETLVQWGNIFPMIYHILVTMNLRI